MTDLEIIRDFKNLIAFLKKQSDKDRTIRAIDELVKQKLIGKREYKVILKEVIDGEDRKS